MSGTRDWVIFQRLFGYGSIRAQKILDIVGHPADLLGLPNSRLDALSLLTPKEARMVLNRPALEQEADRLLEAAHKLGCTVLTPDHDRYPDRLRNIYSPPAVLYVLGTLGDLDQQPAIAMVGTRKHTDYGKQVADDLSFQLAQRGITIVSGLAYGIDTISHAAALRAGGHTVAVLGCGPDTVYPTANRDLHSQIIRSGSAVVTEFPPTEQPLAFHFPIRNRIISGLSLGVVVVEGNRHSGSLITAGHAVTQDREVFAVPGSIYSAMSEATNWLITQGAAMASCAQDILEQFPYLTFPEKPDEEPEQLSLEIPGQKSYPASPAYLNETQSRILELLGEEPQTSDAVLTGTGLPLPAILAALTQLELFGLIETTAGRRFCRK